MDTPEETDAEYWQRRALEAERLLEARSARGPSDVKRIVAEHFALSEADLIGEERSAHIVLARHLAMYLCRQLFKLSFPEIADQFGGRDHTTVMHAVRKITVQRQDELRGTELRTQLIALLRLLDPSSGQEDA